MRAWLSSPSRIALSGSSGSDVTGGVDDEELCELDRVVPAVVRSDWADLQAGFEQIGCKWCGWRTRVDSTGRHCRGGAGRSVGMPPVRGDRRINGVLAAVRGMTVHAVAAGQTSGHLVPLLYEVADDRDVPGEARAGDEQMSWRMRARHRACELETPVAQAADADVAAVLAACRSARDRLIVLLMARAGLRHGEAAGLRRGDAHLLADSRPLGFEFPRPHLHVVRREDNPNGGGLGRGGSG
jgi:integrase/recombinase XerD